MRTVEIGDQVILGGNGYQVGYDAKGKPRMAFMGIVRAVLSPVRYEVELESGKFADFHVSEFVS